MTKNRLSIKHVAFAGVTTAMTLGLAGLGAQSASAATLVQTLIGGNDCSGVFGQGFENCNVSLGDLKFSPVIAKFDTNNGVIPATANEINSSLYPSVDGTEWSFSDLGAGSGTGTWTYTPGENDPGIKYWVAKAANNFNLFWMVDDAAAAGVCSGNAYNADCLAAALTVTTGTWTTPLNRQGDPRSLSHITFYNTGGDHNTVPEPGMLLGLGVMAVAGLSARLKRSQDA